MSWGWEIVQLVKYSISRHGDLNLIPRMDVKLGIVVHASNLSTKETETGEFLAVYYLASLA